MSQIGRFVVKGVDGGQWLHHIDAFNEQGPAIDAAEGVYGHDRVFVIDTHKSGAIVWDSADVPEMPVRTDAK